MTFASGLMFCVLAAGEALIPHALRRLPKGTKHLVLKVLPWGEGVKQSIFVDGQ